MWLLIIIGIIVIVIVVTVYFLSTKTDKSLSKVYNIEAEQVTIPSDTFSIEMGRRFAHILCADCHGGDSFAGKAFFSDPKLGTINSANLTSGKGGIGGTYTDADWIRAIRHGIRKDGTPIIVMPSKDFQNMSEEHLGQVIAYIKTIPPVDKEWNMEPELKTMAKVLASVGAFGVFLAAEEIDHSAPFKKAPAEGPTTAYGEYLVNVFGCRHCHGMELNGGKDPDPNAPFAPNITTGGAFGSWSQSEFDLVMRTGQTPDGRQLSYFMPWQATKNMSDENLQAVYAYLRSIPELESAEQ
jgi:mono/diheme cytochrome c family protein